jgi:GNAT superfamily N-acetyltransferase
MTVINYNKIKQPSADGINMMDRTITIPGIGECVWVCWAEDEDNDIRVIDLHLKEDVLNNFNPLLAYNVHPYSVDKSDALTDSKDVSTVGGVMRFAYRGHGDTIAIVGFFVHPRFRGQGLAKTLLVHGIGIINNFYGQVGQIVLNPKQHPTSPVPTAVLRKWYKDLGFKELGDMLKVIGLSPCSKKKVYKQFPRDIQKKVRTEGDRLLVVSVDKIWNRDRADQILALDLGSLLAEWT